ncbi:MAG: potassium channel family protein [Mycobacteriales bacterium]
MPPPRLSEGLAPVASGRRHPAAATFLRAALTATSLVCLYFLVPISGTPDVGGGVLLVLGLVAFTLLLAWQIRSITLSASPRLRALEVVATAAPLFLLLFATSYFVMERQDTGEFSQALSRVDALYFAVTVFATVGFGDIVAQSQAARVAVTIQMIGDLVFIGLGLRLLLGAVQEGLARQAAPVAEPEQPRSTDPG